MSLNDSFALYLMYKPNGVDSIWATIGMLSWSWNGHITKKAGAQTDIGGVPAKGGTKVKGVESSVLPTWSDTTEALRLRGYQVVP